MTAEREAEAVAGGRRNIIKRPRLTRLLDESTAKIIMLVAPAGYGKTTLAREWLEDKPHAWYQGTAASADVAALALGIADAVCQLMATASERIRDRIRSTAAPDQDVTALAEILQEDLADWPPEAWLAIDDYHAALGSAAAEQLVNLVATRTPVRLILASRYRPTWATSRRLLYGELHEIGRNLLAMNQEEIDEVFSSRTSTSMPGLGALAEGWPAVIGLASLAPDGPGPLDDMSATLYEYFAEELFAVASEDVQRLTCDLSIPQRITQEIQEFVIGEDQSLAEDAVRGLLDTSSRSLEVHPLLRAFLHSKLRCQPDAAIRVNRLVTFLLSRELWDEVFEVVTTFSLTTVLVDLVHRASSSLLCQGRLTTLSRWLDYAYESGIDTPAVDLAAAEIALRNGRYAEAQSLAHLSAVKAPTNCTFISRAFFVAGEAAHRELREQVALNHFARAGEHARTDRDALDALWGQLLSATSLEDPAAVELLSSLDNWHDDSPLLRLRQASARHLFGTRFGSMAGVLEALEGTAHFLRKVDDPFVRTSFRSLLSHALALAGRYEESVRVAEDLLDEAERYRIGFGRAVGLSMRVYGEMGLRRYSVAAAFLDQVEELSVSDKHAAANCRCLRARIRLARGDAAAALAVLSLEVEAAIEPAMKAEYGATRALALASNGSLGAAAAEAAAARALSSGVEALVLAECAVAIVAVRRGLPNAVEHCRRALRTALGVGAVDGFVCSYRSHLGLLETLCREADLHPLLVQLLDRVGDRALGRRLGLIAEERSTVLSKREHQVFELLGQGKTNREIAKLLYISEATAKVHVRRILGKLRLRSRTEAALAASNEGQRTADSSSLRPT